jgi:NADPH:quinone reductase-like Zn-dependent oxidoreductase
MPHAIQIRQTGGPEVLNWTVVDVGEPGSGRVRLRQTAAGLNYIDGFTPTQNSRCYFNHHHTAADTLDEVDPRHLAENAAVMGDHGVRIGSDRCTGAAEPGPDN